MLEAHLQLQQLDRVMAFDFGTQKMGVAFGQSLTQTAQPLDLFTMQDGIPEWPQLLQLIAQWQPNGFLVGLPLNMDDTENELCARARKFAKRLRHQTQKTVWMVDERLTTRTARQHIQQLKANRQTQQKTHNTHADSYAAMMFIEAWFDEPQFIVP